MSGADLTIAEGRMGPYIDESSIANPSPIVSICNLLWRRTFCARLHHLAEQFEQLWFMFLQVHKWILAVLHTKMVSDAAILDLLRLYRSILLHGLDDRGEHGRHAHHVVEERAGLPGGCDCCGEGCVCYLVRDWFVEDFDGLALTRRRFGTLTMGEHRMSEDSHQSLLCDAGLG